MDAAFSFCSEPRFQLFSLNELASRVGISKPAIYRYFKDKDALLDAMRTRFAEELSDCLLAMQRPHGGAIATPASFASIIRFFADNGCYINYAIGSLCSTDGFEQSIAREMKARGVENASGISYEAGTGRPVITDFAQYTKAVFAGVSIFIFIKLREELAQGGQAVSGTDDFSQKLVRLLTAGLRGTTTASDALHPAPVSEERLCELDALCAVTDAMLPEENRIFSALAAVINKYKLTGVTIERLAAEMNLAKSSLYEYFDNKNALITSLIVRELSLVSTIMQENAAEARSFSEYVYVQMATEFSYLQKRPSIIPIFGWLLMNATDDLQQLEETNSWRERFSAPLERPELGFALQARHISSWIGALPVALVIQCRDRGLSAAEMQQALRNTFWFTQHGLDGTR